jgi:carboxymethylenebutenolidase
MGKTVELQAADGHTLSAYVAEPAGAPRGGIVVVQEIFGVNSHIRSVADGYAKDGYLAIAPAIFDRVQRGYETGYEQADVQKGMEFVGKLNFDDVLKDVAAAVEYAHAGLGADARSAKAASVGLVGFCYGGTLAWLAAAKVPGLAAVVGYYGGYIPNFIESTPQVPTLLHFGEHDQHPSPEGARKTLAAHPEVAGHFYDAGHGFNCDQRGSFNAAAATLARERTLEFFRTHVG